MSDVTILGLPPSTYVRTVMMICAIKGVEYTLEPVNFRAPDFRKHHPFAKMPVLRHSDIEVFETLAITTYLDEAFDGPALQPNGALPRARMMQWISAINHYIYDSMVTGCVSERFIKPMRGQEPDEAAIAAMVPEIALQLDLLDGVLVDQDYLCGEISLADLFLAPIIVYLNATPEGKTLLPERKAVTAWLKRIAATPRFTEINKIG